MFSISSNPLDLPALRAKVLDPSCGAITSYEGLVRNHNEGRVVTSLEYDAHPVLADKEGQRIMLEALDSFDITRAVACHRIGHLAIGDLAVAVFVASAHRQAAFDAGRFLIDAIKARVPVWKREYFADGSSEWLGPCPGCQYSH